MPLATIPYILNFPHTTAYYNNCDVFQNNLSCSDYSSSVYEIFNPSDTWDDNIINKDLFIQNDSKSKVSQAVRIRYFEYIIDDNSQYQSLIDENGSELIRKVWADCGLNSNMWKKYGDWYYYNAPLDSGKQLHVLDYIQKLNDVPSNLTYTLNFEVEVIPFTECSQNWGISIPIN